VFSFGMNNKGQCGREFPTKKDSSESGAAAAAVAASASSAAGSVADSKLIPMSPSGSPAVAAATSAGAAAVIDDGSSDLDFESDQPVGYFSICKREKHRWKHDQCMVCVLCGECTGYGSTCVSSGRPDRNPGMICGCGSGDSGCSECGVCRMCAGDDDVGALDGGAIGGGGAEADVIVQHAAAAAAAANDDLLGIGGGPVRNMFAAALGQVGAFQQPRAPFHHLEHREKFIRRRLQKLGNSGSGSRRSRRHTEKDKRRQGVVGGGNEDDVVRQAERSNKERNMALNAATAAATAASASDVEKEAGKLVSLPPAKILLPKEVKIVQIASGLHHTLLLSSSGAVYAFGSNSHGQLGQCDLIPRGAPTLVPLGSQHKAGGIAAGSYHSVVLTTTGEVLTFGSSGKGQLGRDPPDQQAKLVSEPALVELWYAIPGVIPNVGPQFGRTATWIGASSEQTFVKVDESLINAKSLSSASIMANGRHILLLPKASTKSTFNCLAISRHDGFCRSFVGDDQEDLSSAAANIDPLFNVLWAYDHGKQTLKSYVPSAGEFADRAAQEESDLAAVKAMMPSTILSPELALPMSPGSLVSRNQTSLNLLSCLDMLNLMPDVNLSAIEEDSAKSMANKSFTKEDFSVVNRFDSHGGGWGYSGHSIEAIRFSTDTDVLLGGFGLFGGRGEYVGKIRLFDIGPDGGEQETDGEVVAESEEVTYECGARHKYPILFDEPVAVQAGRWYVAWARVSGPSSDCGSSGQTQVTTDDQVQFSFKSSKKSNNGTDVNAGQVPQLLYKIVTTESQSLQNRRSDPSEPICILTSKFSRTVTSECFQALLALVQWSWNAFKAGLIDLLEADESENQQAAALDLDRLMFICRASLRLIVTYTHEVYPVRVVPGQSKPVSENQLIAEAVYDTRTMLQTMLKDPLSVLEKATLRLPTKPPQLKSSQRMAGLLLADAHRTFVSCFHAFYPTGYLKWSCLCNLLASMEDESSSSNHSYDRLLTAVLDALCSPMVKLRNTFPITYSPETETASRCRNLSPAENLSLTASMIQAGDAVGSTSSQQRFPILHELMNYQSHLDGVRFASWSFREVLDRLLEIVSLPVKQGLRGEPIVFSRDLEEKACHVVSAVISELANETVSSESDIQNLGGRILHVTPNR
jgi:E3 ubiquitin-protein ligase MYCBP2